MCVCIYIYTIQPFHLHDNGLIQEKQAIVGNVIDFIAHFRACDDSNPYNLLLHINIYSILQRFVDAGHCWQWR